MKSFQDSHAWQKGMDLNEAVDIALAENKNWGFRDQLFRASLSICNNIAEGFEMPTTPHQLRYLWIAKGSCNEVCSMLLLAKRRSYFPTEQVDQMLQLQDETSRLLRTYIKIKAGKLGKLPGGLALLFLWAKITTPFLLPS
jgi:four helix bundle protein